MLQTFERLANKRLPTESAAVLEHFAAAAVGKASIKGKKAAAAAAASLPTAVARPFAGFVTHWVWSLPETVLPWVVDCFLLEGPKTFYRIGLALLTGWGVAGSSSSSSSSSVGSGSGGGGGSKQHQIRQPSAMAEFMAVARGADVDTLIAKAFDFRFKSVRVLLARWSGKILADKRGR